MIGTIDFRHDVENDIVIATPNWKIETKEDCEAWTRQYADYLGKFYRPVDIIFVLDDFVVTSGIIAEWGEYRAKVVTSYTRFSRRVHSKSLVNIIVKASAIKHNASNEVADSVEEAIEAIKAQRVNAGVK
ncbi:MAG: hypothetical protein WAO71_13440 [Gallionella sp.]